MLETKFFGMPALQDICPYFVFFNYKERHTSYKIMYRNLWEKPVESELELRESEVGEHPFKVTLDSHVLYMWKVGYEALHPVKKIWIPVLDTGYKHLFLGAYCYSEKGSSYDMVKRRHEAQRFYMHIYFNDLKKSVSPIPAFVAELIKKDAINKKDACPISMNPFEECDNLMLTSCYHLFEYTSLRMWLKKNTSCPLCNAAITSTRILEV